MANPYLVTGGGRRAWPLVPPKEPKATGRASARALRLERSHAPPAPTLTRTPVATPPADPASAEKTRARARVAGAAALPPLLVSASGLTKTHNGARRRGGCRRTWRDGLGHSHIRPGGGRPACPVQGAERRTRTTAGQPHHLLARASQSLQYRARPGSRPGQGVTREPGRTWRRGAGARTGCASKCCNDSSTSHFEAVIGVWVDHRPLCPRGLALSGGHADTGSA